MRVLEGLDGIEALEMILDRDAFQVSYAPARVNVDSILARIRKLGFRPDTVPGEPPPAALPSAPPGGLPARIKEALRAAREEDRFLLIDFSADWCEPCLALEKEIHADPGLMETLERFHVLRIDTDRDPEIARRLRVFALPTLVALDGNGMEVYRHAGGVRASALSGDLKRVRGEKN